MVIPFKHVLFLSFLRSLHPYVNIYHVRLAIANRIVITYQIKKSPKALLYFTPIILNQPGMKNSRTVFRYFSILSFSKSCMIGSKHAVR